MTALHENQKPVPATQGPIPSALVESALRLRERTRRLRYAAPVTHVYRPLDYAWDAHAAYLERYAGLGATALLVGMNPGPWGMAQTGIPFGEVGAVRDWLKIDATIRRPREEHPKRPVDGLSCRRSEVSGARLWGWAAARFGTPQRFFRRFFIANYCPLCFMESTGRNRTPDKLSAAERSSLYDVCDAALRETVAALRPRIVVGVGAFAEGRIRAALDGMSLGGRSIKFGRMPHPSPASPSANRGWAAQADQALAALGAI